MEHETQYAVVVKDLVRTFGKFTAVNHISFQIKPGEVFGFLGPNGAGKSTTIRMLTGILAPTSGQGIVAGLDIFTQAEIIKTKIGYMSQKFSLYEDLTVEENINFYNGIYQVPVEKRSQRKQWALEMAGLTSHRRSLTRILSTGWKQRLALGCAILHEPPILFLDEPTSGVDPISRREFWDLIYDLSNQGVTVFVTTHYMDEAEYCDRLGLIYRGELIAIDTPEHLKTRFMREDVLEVGCEHPQQALEEIEKIDAVREAAVFGKYLHVVTSDREHAEQAIKSLLGRMNLRCDHVTKIVPSLEDVFVSLIEARDRVEQPMQEVAR
ncbi:MAG: ABC transporter ATP-binding protein [Phycisphaerae bacterium]|jgi:ABC-2 type transport system ATP-binding protein|nr:ABC transporter ATP-binding protein [Phycisphaerae bacterium]